MFKIEKASSPKKKIMKIVCLKVKCIMDVPRKRKIVFNTYNALYSKLMKER